MLSQVEALETQNLVKGTGLFSPHFKQVLASYSFNYVMAASCHVALTTSKRSLSCRGIMATVPEQSKVKQSWYYAVESQNKLHQAA